MNLIHLSLVTLLVANCAGNSKVENSSKTNNFSDYSEQVLACGISFEELQSDGAHIEVHSLNAILKISAASKAIPFEAKNTHGGFVAITYMSAKDMFETKSSLSGTETQDGMGFAIETLASAVTKPKKHMTFVDLSADSIFFYQSFDVDQTIKNLELADKKSINIDRINVLCKSGAAQAEIPAEW